ncbi:MAG: CHAT domain-containing protein [Desertifilum sp.]|nr:CHAT domain-containing protein [Desertifilum sp.]
MITRNGPPVRKRLAGVTRSQVTQIANNFKSEVTNPRRINTTSYLPPAQRLYGWIVAPLKPDLEEREIDNLVFILDVGLRSTPLAAIHSGEQFLVQEYSVGLMPSLSLVDTRYVDIKQTQVLAMGSSEFTDQSPLPAVPTEVRTIVQEWSGDSFLNQAFTLSNLKAARSRRPYGIVHLATHGEFRAGAPSNSYIQLWDERLQLDQMRQLGWANPPVHLVVLSACRTALGDEQAELGFGGFAVQSGAKSALASLWYVSDEGTLGLMSDFYTQLKTAPIKAEALRRTQVAMLEGQVRVENNQLQIPGLGTVPLPSTLLSGQENLSHPYFWSAFTLIGNPW